MTVHVYWRHLEYPADPFIHLGTASGAFTEDAPESFDAMAQLVLDSDESLGICAVWLPDFEGRPPPRDVKPLQRKDTLPLGEYQIVNTVTGGKWTLRGVGVPNQKALLAVADDIEAGTKPTLENRAMARMLFVGGSQDGVFRDAPDGRNSFLSPVKAPDAQVEYRTESYRQRTVAFTVYKTVDAWTDGDEWVRHAMRGTVHRGTAVANEKEYFDFFCLHELLDEPEKELLLPHCRHVPAECCEQLWPFPDYLTPDQLAELLTAADWIEENDGKGEWEHVWRMLRSEPAESEVAAFAKSEPADIRQVLAVLPEGFELAHQLLPAVCSRDITVAVNGESRSHDRIWAYSSARPSAEDLAAAFAAGAIRGGAPIYMNPAGTVSQMNQMDNFTGIARAQD